MLLARAQLRLRLLQAALVFLQAEDKAQGPLQRRCIQLAFGEIIASSASHSLHRYLLITVPGKENDWQVQSPAANFPQDVQAGIHPELVVKKEHVVAGLL